jgi:ABC-2 type transport system ATP-binding protein
MKAITAEGLVKTYRSGKDEVHALDNLDLEVEEGTVLGLLGPNGAGKTTTVRILTTLLRPDRGKAMVAGFDVVREAEKLRGIIGLSGQYAAVDENLTGRENLSMFGQLYQLSSKTAKSRADELLGQFELSDAGDRVVKTYSGGMRRRLDLASALIARPRLLFLDEPTTGLDPRSRLSLWEVIRGLVQQGTTLLLTTQYLEEADELADTIAVVDHGRVIASGTATELKSSVGGERIEVTVDHAEQVDQAIDIIRQVGAGEPHVEHESRRITIPANEGAKQLVQVVRGLDDASIHVEDIGLRRPTLDDVFLTLTGRAADEVGDNGNGALAEAAARSH